MHRAVRLFAFLRHFTEKTYYNRDLVRPDVLWSWLRGDYIRAILRTKNTSYDFATNLGTVKRSARYLKNL